MCSEIVARVRRGGLKESRAAGRRRLAVAEVPVPAANGQVSSAERRRAALHEPGHHRRVVTVGSFGSGQTSVRTGSSLEEPAVHALALAAVPVKGCRRLPGV